MKKTVSNHSLLRILSLLALGLVFISAFVFGKKNLTDSFILSFSSFDLLLLIYPLSYQKLLLSFVFVPVITLLSVIAAVSANDTSTLFMICRFILVLYVFLRSRTRFGKVRQLFRNYGIWYFTEDCSHLFYCMLYLLFQGLCECVFSAIVYALLAAVLYFRSVTSFTMYLTAAKEREIRDICYGQIQDRIVDNLLEDAGMNAMYNRIVQLMETKKPFLDPHFSIHDMSQLLFTNKSYVSRTVNIFSNKNFCQFVNYYRIQYATDLAEKDPFLRVTQLALMSGFRSNVSFNMAFKSFVGKNPGEYLRERQTGRL